MTESDLLLTPGAAPVAQRLGPYVLEAVLGAGSQGVVYRATDVLLRRPAAVKVATGSAGNQPGLMEARLISTLDHPNIVRVYHVERVAGGWYMAMELMDGGNAWDLLSGGPLAAERAVRLVIQAAEALEHAHHAGITHRDVKLQNLLLNRSGQVKLSDFGLAVRGRSIADGTVGTPLYVAPETWRGEETGAAADIYALGTCLYMLLTGRGPYQATSIDALRKAHLSGTPAPLDEQPEPLARLVMACLQRDPNARPSAHALRRQLKNLLPLLDPSVERYFPFVSATLRHPNHLMQVILGFPAFAEARRALGRTLETGGRPFLAATARYCVCLQALLLLATEDVAMPQVERVLIDDQVALGERLGQLQSLLQSNPHESVPERVVLQLHLRRDLSSDEVDLLFRQVELPTRRPFLFVLTGLPECLTALRRDAEGTGREALLRWLSVPRLSAAELAALARGWAAALGISIRLWSPDALRLLRAYEEEGNVEVLIHNALMLTAWLGRSVLTTFAVEGAWAHPCWLTDPEEVIPVWRSPPPTWPEARLLSRLQALRAVERSP